MEKSQQYIRRTSDQMFPLVERYKSGDQSQKVFCEQYGLQVSTFHYWLKKYREQSSTQSAHSFQQIKVLADQPGESQQYRQIEILNPSGVEIKIPLD